MHDDHLRWPVGSALKPGDQALGPLPYAGDVNGFWLGRVRRNPLLLGKAPLRSGQDFGLGAMFLSFFHQSVHDRTHRGRVADFHSSLTHNRTS